MAMDISGGRIKNERLTALFFPHPQNQELKAFDGPNCWGCGVQEAEYWEGKLGRGNLMCCVSKIIYHQFSASAVELEFLRSERRLRSGKHFA
jgi:hypothetical protein